jgi:hypothetical protein
MMLNPCSQIQTQIDPRVSTCKTFADGSVYQGMAVALTRYFENLRYLYTLYIRYSKNPKIKFENKNLIPYVIIFDNKIQDNLINLLNLEESLEVDKMQYIYVKETFRYLINEFKEGINNEYSA